MRLKDLVMLLDFADVAKATEKIYAHSTPEETAEALEVTKRVFALLREMEPRSTSMILEVAPFDVSGYYGEKARVKKDKKGILYALSGTRWREWLGMTLDRKTVADMPIPDIVAHCIFEMTWWGPTEPVIRRNLREAFGPECFPR